MIRYRPHSSCPRHFPAWIAVLVLTASSLAYAAAPPSKSTTMRMYRYTNDKGVVVTGNSIKPEYARKGYQIVNMSGDVLETIPPEPTAEERQQIEQNAQDKLTAEQQLEQDKQLLLRYSTLDELKRGKERKLAEIDSKIKMLQANISSLQQQIDYEQKQAANFERSGRPVPPAMVAKLQGLRQEMKVSESQKISREQELAVETSRFDKEIERYIYLDQKRGKHH